MDKQLRDEMAAAVQAACDVLGTDTLDSTVATLAGCALIATRVSNAITEASKVLAIKLDRITARVPR